MIIKERINAVINSKDRINPENTTSSDFTISFNRVAQRIVEIIIESIQIPFSFYTINDTNNTLNILFNGGNTEYTIENGNYTATSLVTELKNVLGGGYNVTFSPKTFKYTITNNTEFRVDILSPLAKILGFKKNPDPLIFYTSRVGDGTINISGPNYLLLSSGYFTRLINSNTLYSNNDYNNVLMLIPVNVSPGDIINLSPRLQLRLAYKANITINDIIDIQITDEFNNIIDLNGLDVSLNLTFITE
jgi:hypothetical protein